MSVSFAMILFGAILIIGGWKDLSIGSLARGDDTKPKPAIVGAAA